jgi:hypothetical protein
MYSGSRLWWTATSNGVPPVTVATPLARAAANLRRVDSSSAISQAAVESFNDVIRWPLWARWLTTLSGS